MADRYPHYDEYHDYGLMRISPNQYVKCSKACCVKKSRRKERMEAEAAALAAAEAEQEGL